MLDELTRAVETAPDRAALARELVRTKDDGRIKLYVIREALACRRARAALFGDGDYRPLETQGPLAEYALAFARVGNGTAALTVVPRLFARRGADGPPLGTTYWDDESRVLVPLEAGARLVNTLTGERLTVEGGGVRLADILSNFPVALLVTPD
jgi:maltooligosyltrehalose synthase